MRKFLFMALLFFVLPMNSNANDQQQLKIEQLETLLKNYMEENKALKAENQNLKGRLSLIKISKGKSKNIATPDCKADLGACSDEDLCETATYGLLDDRKWKIGSYVAHVEEAKNRGLSCNVVELKVVADVTKGKGQTAVVSDATAPDCRADLGACSDEDLCETATYGLLDDRKWKIGSYKAFVDEAGRRGLTCDVLTADQREQAELAEFSNAEICSKATHESSKGLRLNVDRDSEKFIREAGRRSQSCASLTNELVDLNIAQIQTRLHNLGYDPGLIDGAWGGKTKKAFEVFLKDYAQTELDAKNPEAETLLYDIYEQKFEQTVRSSVPCKLITYDYERNNRGDCVVIAQYNTTSPNLFANKSEGELLSPLWDKKAIYPLIRETKKSNPEIVLWAPDQPIKPWTAHDGPGLAHMANFKIDIESIFQNRNAISVINQSRKMPFSVRRYELVDLNNDGTDELFLLGSREDGRSGGNYKKIDKVPGNMIDYNFIYDFKFDKITTFGQRSFSHDYGIHDFDSDGFKDILDLTLSERGGHGGYFFCDGKSLKCNWRSTDQFINGHSFLAYEKATDKVFLNARCGERHVRDQNNGKFWLCWFSVEDQGPKLKFNFIQKFELQKPFDAKIKWQTFFGEIKNKAYQGWKVDGYTVDERIRKSAGGSVAVFEDLDNDGDLDMITHRKDHYCIKKDKSRGYYNDKDCDQSSHKDYVFLQRGGKFKLSQVIEGGIRDETINYDFEDLNRDSYPDIIPRGVYYGKCVDTYENVLINNRDGTFYRTDEKFSGRYGCELASNFFEHDGQRYRAFTFKKKVKEFTGSDFDVYVAIEKLSSR